MIFSLLLFSNYPPPYVNRLGLPVFVLRAAQVPDWPLVNVSISFVKEVEKLYHALDEYTTSLADMIEFALDGAG